MKVAVGSTNPVKITAVSQIFRRVWPDAEVMSVSVPSGVTEMPMTDEETRIVMNVRALENNRSCSVEDAGMRSGIAEIEATINWSEEGLVDHFLYADEYGGTDRQWQAYFLAFNHAARPGR